MRGGGRDGVLEADLGRLLPQRLNHGQRPLARGVGAHGDEAVPHRAPRHARGRVDEAHVVRGGGGALGERHAVAAADSLVGDALGGVLVVGAVLALPGGGVPRGAHVAVVHGADEVHDGGVVRLVVLEPRRGLTVGRPEPRRRLVLDPRPVEGAVRGVRVDLGRGQERSDCGGMWDVGCGMWDVGYGR